MVWIVYLFYFVVPCLVLLRVWLSRNQSLITWICESTLYSAYILDVFLTGPWHLVGYYSRFALLALFLLGLIRSYRAIKNKSFLLKIPLTKVFSCFVGLAIAAFFVLRVALYIQATSLPGKAVALDFPLKEGCFYVAQGGSNVVVNHHTPLPAQQYALDIVRLDAFGFRAKKWLTSEALDYYIHGTKVFSPCSGIVLEYVDDYPDMELNKRDTRNPAGNYIAISLDNSDIVVVLAHLMKGSFTVKLGDRVTTSTLLAKIGNSGNISEPHLHIHAVKKGDKDSLFWGQGVPITFNDQFLVRNSVLNTNPRNTFANAEAP